MYDFSLQLFLVGSLSVMVYILIRALPRVVDEGKQITIYDYFDQWLERLPLHHLDERINAFLYKFLKHTRVVVMKIDNRLMQYVDRVKRNGEKKESPVQELLNQVNEDKKEK